MREQIRARSRELPQPLVTMEAALGFNYALGVIHGIRFVLKMPDQIIRLEKEQFEEWLENERASTRTDGESYDSDA